MDHILFLYWDNFFYRHRLLNTSIYSEKTTLKLQKNQLNPP